MIAIALGFRTPGKYHLGRQRIGHVRAGKAGWQDFYIRTLNLTAAPQRAAAPHLYSPSRCAKYMAPSVASYFVHNVGQGGYGATGTLDSNGTSALPLQQSGSERSMGGISRSRLPGAAGGAVGIPCRSVGASPRAQATDRICAGPVARGSQRPDDTGPGPASVRPSARTSHRCRVLCQSSAVYQFRHIELQRRLASRSPIPSPDNPRCRSGPRSTRTALSPKPRSRPSGAPSSYASSLARSAAHSPHRRGPAVRTLRKCCGSR